MRSSAPAEAYTRRPSGDAANPIHACLTGTRSTTSFLTQSSTARNCGPNPLLVTTAYLEPGTATTRSGIPPRAICVPAGERAQPLGRRIRPSIVRPGEFAGGAAPDNRARRTIRITTEGLTELCVAHRRL